MPSSKLAQDEEAEWLGQLASDFPEEYLESDYSISCSLPSPACPNLIGRNGEKIMEIERLTNTKITFEKGGKGCCDGYRQEESIMFPSWVCFR